MVTNWQQKKIKVMSHSGALIWSLSTFFVTDILGFSQVDQRLGKSFKVHLGIAKKVEDSQKGEKSSHFMPIGNIQVVCLLASTRDNSFLKIFYYFLQTYLGGNF